jgi:hypothetical protein
MKELLGITLSFAILAGMTALAVERFGDRELFVSPPDAVVEDFVRAVVNGRYDQARAFLADEHSMPDDELRALQAELGDPSHIDAKIASRDDTRAVVNVRTTENALTFALAFDREWKIVR